MKRLLVLTIFIGSGLLADAQTSAAGSGSGQRAKTRSQVKKSPTQLRGSGQYHGSKDTTPGSPMGTGGAGGNEMSGSPAGSASEAAIQKDKAAAPPAGQGASDGNQSKKANTRKKGKP